MTKLILMDGNSIAYRAFFALPLLSNSSGLHTNAVYGFTTMLTRLIEEEQPTHILVAFDAGKVTFRHKDFEEYKGGRAKTPPELSEQFPLIKELLDAFSISRFELEGYEADDIIGTLSKISEQDQMDVLIVTGDKDMLQLASDRVTVALTRKGISEVERYNPQMIQDKYGLTPEQIIDLKGLMGDTSDNIPGIPGVGEKTALKLLHQYASVENVLDHTHEISGKLREKIENHAQDARLSKELATIFRSVPLELNWDQLKFSGADEDKLFPVFQKLEFKSLLEKMGGSGKSEPKEAEQFPIVIIDRKTWPELCEMLPETKAVQVEIVGDNPHHGEVLGFGFFLREKGYFVPYEQIDTEEAKPLIRWLESEQQEKWVYDRHKAELMLAWRGIQLKGVARDVLLAAYLLDPTESEHSLHALAQQYGQPGLPSDEQVYGKGAKFQIPDKQVLSEHVCRKAAAVSRIIPLLHEALQKNEMHSLYYDLELPLASVLAHLEKTGIRVDAEELKAYGVQLGEQLVQLTSDIYGLAGTEFNIGSPKQLGEILFEKLGLPTIKKTKTGYSTDAEVLEKLEPYHPIIGKILHYRQLSKLQSTYIEGLLKEIRPNTGKVHTYYQQTIAATGRLSSQYPNLQNIPIRMEEGRKIRKVFIPSEPGWQILSADYSQIELRVLAHISQDERLKEAFVRNMDIHTKTAMDVFGVEEHEVDANMRRQAKAVNFGIVYGISDYGLSQNLNITRKEAARFIEQYFDVFQGVRRYMDDIVKQAKRDGYVTTLLQRRRYLPEINASNFNLRSFAERTAMNTPIQGTAADIIKLAMVRLFNWLKQSGLKSRMLLQVHDELVLEVAPDELELVKQQVIEKMEYALQLDVPLKVDVHCGDNWYEAK